MSQGLKNAPAALARVMQAIFKGISFKCMQHFFDDILIYSQILIRTLHKCVKYLHEFAKAALSSI